MFITVHIYISIIQKNNDFIYHMITMSIIYSFTLQFFTSLACLASSSSDVKCLDLPLYDFPRPGDDKIKRFTGHCSASLSSNGGNKSSDGSDLDEGVEIS